MAICWPAVNSRDSGVVDGAGNREIRFAPLPGSREAYRFATKTWEPRAADESPHVPLLSVAGRLAAITSSTAVPARAQSLVLWLAGREVSSVVAPQAASTTLFRQSQVASAGRWTGNLPADAAQHYGNLVAKTLTLPRAFPGLRLPGREQYVAALDTAVHDAIGKGGDPRTALAKARERWQQITEQLGAASQKKANARSLGEDGP
jgi:multiple sugar transport system substrate-binding protein